MEINDTLTLEDLSSPEGVELIADDPAEVTLVTLSPPRVEESSRRPTSPNPSRKLVGEGEEGGEDAAGGDEGDSSSDEE